jgi:hypothetical protein
MRALKLVDGPAIRAVPPQHAAPSRGCRARRNWGAPPHRVALQDPHPIGRQARPFPGEGAAAPGPSVDDRLRPCGWSNRRDFSGVKCGWHNVAGSRAVAGRGSMRASTGAGGVGEREALGCATLGRRPSGARRWSSTHQSHFTRAFKRYTGLTPNAYRGSPRR